MTEAFLNARSVPVGMRMIHIGSIVPSALLLFTEPACLSVDVFASTDLCSELFFFVLKSEVCLQTASSSKVRFSHKVILQSSAGLQVPQK